MKVVARAAEDFNAHNPYKRICFQFLATKITTKYFILEIIRFLATESITKILVTNNHQARVYLPASRCLQMKANTLD